VLLIAFLSLALPILTLLSVAIGAGFTLLVKRPVSISISTRELEDRDGAQDLPPGDLPSCCYCRRIISEDPAMRDSWVCLVYTNKPPLHACSESHLEQFFVQGTPGG
jgi:hypothetical protein